MVVINRTHVDKLKTHRNKYHMLLSPGNLTANVSCICVPQFACDQRTFFLNTAYRHCAVCFAVRLRHYAERNVGKWRATKEIPILLNTFTTWRTNKVIRIITRRVVKDIEFLCLSRVMPRRVVCPSVSDVQVSWSHRWTSAWLSQFTTGVGCTLLYTGTVCEGQ